MQRLGLGGLKYLVALVAMLSLVLVPGVVWAATSATVTINATPSFVGISVNVSSFDFGSVVAGVDENTSAGYFGITNGSTVPTDNTIVASGWVHTAGSNNWTWGAPAANTGQLKASCATGNYSVTVDDATPVDLINGVAAGMGWSFELELDAPTSFTHGDPQTTTVTIAASAA